MKQTKSEYFLNLCKVVASRSIDPNTQHGCVVVNRHGKILSTGYNGPLPGMDDTRVPLTRPEKYMFFEHSERNAIYSAAQHGTSLNGSLFYITGAPCIDCLRAIISVGAKGVIFGDTKSACVVNDDYKTLMSLYPAFNVIKDCSVAMKTNGETFVYSQYKGVEMFDEIFKG